MYITNYIHIKFWGTIIMLQTCANTPTPTGAAAFARKESRGKRSYVRYS